MPTAVKAVALAAVAGVVALGLLLYLLGSFREPVRYDLRHGTDLTPESHGLLVQGLTDSIGAIGKPTGFWVEAEAIYRARLEAIRQAHHTIDFETYVMTPGRRADAFAQALAARAKAGVRVRMVVDAYGTRQLPEGYWRRLRESGVRVVRYRAFSWRAPLLYNARTHRKLLLIDNRRALIGGAGVSDRWDGEAGQRPWRDFELALEGPVVAALTGLFYQNWLVEGRDMDARDVATEDNRALARGSNVLVTNGSPSQGSSSHQLLFNLHLASARRRVWIASPYFLPGPGLLGAMAAAQRRGVDVRLLTVGPRSDKPMIRWGARETYGALLEAGVAVYEYAPGMMHAKAMLVDRDSVTAGSANFDARSFFRNDELTITVQDAGLASRLEAFFQESFERSHRVEPPSWERRPTLESWVGRGLLVFRRQL
jgi:cardiolipin synthase